MSGELKNRLDFIMEIDRMKGIMRKSKIFHCDRKENGAEHGWHVSIAALLLAEYANEKVDMLRVLKMLLVHNLDKILASDKILYRKTQEDLETERTAAKQVFGQLPAPQNQEYYDLWVEFKDKITPEAKFAGAVDGFLPLMQNTIRDGQEWRAYQITYDEVMERNRKIAEGSRVLWKHIKEEINIADGYDFSEDMNITE